MRKKILAVVLCLMTAVAFMPTFAFAAATPKWADDYSYVTYNGVDYPAVRELVDTKDRGDQFCWNGEIKASVDTSKTEVDPEIAPVTYYDLDNISVVKSNETEAVNLKAIMSADGFTGNFPQDQAYATMILKFNVPSYVENYSTYKNFVAGSQYNYNRSWHRADSNEKTSMDNWTVKVKTPAYDEEKAYEIQKFDLSWIWTNTAAAGVVYTPVAGKLADLAITVKPEEKKISEMTSTDYVIDGKNALTAGVDYDGAKHVITQKAYPGITSTYEIWENGKWVAVDEAAVTDAGTYKFRAIATDGTAKPKIDLPAVTVDEATAPTVGFEENDKYSTDKYKFDVEEGFDAKDYVIAYAGSEAGESDAKAKANKKALAANEELLMEYFYTYYEVNTEAKKYDKTSVTGTIDEIEDLEFTTAEKDAIVAKYGDMLANFDVEVTRANAGECLINLNRETESAAFTIKDAPDTDVLENSIDWEKAPLKVTYKAKALKKKAQKITISAVAESGVACTYALSNGGSKIKINKETGKITVKKGLKKGTYKVVVKAKVAKGNGYAATSDEYDLKVVVK